MSVNKLTTPPTPQEQINKINEIIDNLEQGSGGLSYTATCPAITISSGIASWSVTHNLGTTSVIAMLYNSSGAKQECNVVVNSTNAITVSFKASANVTAGSYTIVVLGSGASSDTSNLANKDFSNVTNTGKIAIAHNAMPQGERSYQFTFGANGAAYTAPADGYVQMYAEATGSGAFIGIYSTSVSVMAVPFTSSSDCRGFFPIKKGQVFTCWFANVKNQNLTFFYAIGSESEYVGS